MCSNLCFCGQYYIRVWVLCKIASLALIMKIAIVLKNYEPSVGGMQKLFKEIAERLVHDYNDEVEIITTNLYRSPHKPDNKIIAKQTEVINGVKVNRFSVILFHITIINWLNILFKKTLNVTVKNIEWIKTVMYSPVSAGLKNKMLSTNADIIIGSSHACTFMHYPLSAVQKNKKKPFIFQGAIHFKEDGKPIFLTGKMLKAINASNSFIANTMYEKERLVQMGVAENKIEVIGCGVDIKKFESFTANDFRNKNNIAAGDTVIGYVGRIVSYKGLSTLLEAFAILLKSTTAVKLIIAGSSSSYVEVLKKQAAAIDNTADKIIFKTDLSDNEIAEVHNSLNIFVLPSAEESFGIVFLEAWACKKPVIGINIGAVASLVQHNRDGLLSNPRNPVQLSENLQYLINNPDEQKRLGENGYKKVLANYTWDKVTAAYRKVFENAINSNIYK